MKDSAIAKLSRLCISIANSDELLSELELDIEKKHKNSALKSLITSQLRCTNIQNLGLNQEFHSLFFHPKTITEFNLYSSKNLGISCYFMSEGSYFPMHDHPNRVTITGVLFGSIRYAVFNKTDEESVMCMTNKGSGKLGKIMFNTLRYNNFHTILAEENSIIIDIFMHNADDPGNYYKVIRRDLKKFYVKMDSNAFFLRRSFKVLPLC